jgi:hypothetical protein
MFDDNALFLTLESSTRQGVWNLKRRIQHDPGSRGWNHTTLIRAMLFWQMVV